MYMTDFIYIYSGHACAHVRVRRSPPTASLLTKILAFRGFDSSRILILRDGIPKPIGDFPEGLSQRILAGRFLAARFAVDVFLLLLLL